MAKKATKAKSASISRSGNDYTFKWSAGSYWNSRQAAINVNGEGWKWANTGASSMKKTINRNSYYPKTSRKLSFVMGHVRGYHSSKTKGWSPAAEPKFSFSRPAAPTIGGVTIADGKMTMSWKIGDSNTSGAERYDLVVTTKRETNRRAEVADGGVKVTIIENNKSISTARGAAEGTHSVLEGASVDHPDEYIKYIFEWRCRGLAGDSDVRTVSYVYEYADTPVLKSVNADVAGGVISAIFEQHGAERRRHVSKSWLQYQACDGLPVERNWSNVDDAETTKDGATGLNCSVSQIVREASDINVWFRVVNRYMNDATVSVSNPLECEELRLPAYDTSTPDRSVLEVEHVESAGADGILVTIGWADDANIGTTISWSTDVDAWNSTTEPASFDLPDSRWRKDGESHANQATVKVAKLEENTLYFFRARRYVSNTQAGGWTDEARCVTGSTAGVTMSCPATIGIGEELTVRWALGGAKPQTGWRVEVNGVTVADGDGTATAAVIPGDLLEPGSSTVCVWATTGGAWVKSNEATIGIFQRPVATIAAANITAKPATATVAADVVGTVADVALVARGCVVTRPDGTDATQYEHEVIWRTSVPLETSDGSVSSVVSVPSDVLLVDGAQYAWEVIPSANGLTGQLVTSGTVEVAWAHQAVAPTCTMVKDEDALTVTVTPIAPEGAVATDVCDIYRDTENGAYLIAESVAFGTPIVDRYASFQYRADSDVTAGYVLCTRTADGDVAWADFNHGMTCDALVIDWGGKQVRLPYDLTANVDWNKRVELKDYLDGTKRAWYLDGRDMAESISTTIARLGDGEQKSLLADLAAWASTAYVRDPFGHAFEGNVDVRGKWAASSALVSYDISATEVSLRGFLGEEVTE